MSDKRRIISVDQVRDDMVLIYLVDGTLIEVTLDQLLNSGVPRYPVPPGDEGFQAAIRKAINRTRVN